MKKINSRIACGVLAAAMCVTGLSGCGKLDGTQTVATIDGENITLGLASYVARDQQAQTESYYQMMAQSYGIDASAGIWDDEGEDGKTYGESAKDDVMDNLLQLYVLRAHAKDYDVSISEEEQTAIDEAAAAFMEANDEAALEELAVAESDIVTYMQLMTYRQKMQEPMRAGADKEVSDDEANQTKVTYVFVSTEGTEEDEDGNKIELTEEEKAEKKATAESVLEKMEAEENIADADMDALAKEVDENLIAVTADYTTAGSEDDNMNQAVIDASKDLADGELLNELAEGDDGYYVIRKDLEFDEEGTANKKEQIITEREDEAYNALLDEWKEAADMKIENSVWKKVKITDSKSFTYKTEDAAAESTPAESTPTEDAATDDAATDDAAAADDAAATDDAATDDTAADAE
ncbi:MAG: hypothetical protein EOM40_06760 [Clostridia bacterium]|nr:hypothetical protein [Clostridia bacterium]NCC42085.1 hypothetical protein [Clostridia bacterium]